jgi:hypothetical protein
MPYNLPQTVLRHNPRLKALYVCKRCKAYYTSATDMHMHDRTVHGQDPDTIMVFTAERVRRPST